MDRNHEENIREYIRTLEEMKIEVPEQIEKIVDVKAFGAKEGRGYCNTQAFTDAIDCCRAVKGAKLHIPKGTYYFQEPVADKRGYVVLDDIEELIVEGNGAELIFAAPYPYISLRDSKRCQVHNLILDWDWEKEPLSSLGVVIKVSRDEGYFDCHFPGVQVLPEQFEIKIVGPFNPSQTTPGIAGGIEFRPYVNNHLVLTDSAEDDEKMRKLVREESNVIKCMEKIEPQVMRFYTVEQVLERIHIEEGQCYNFRHFEYDTTAIVLRDSEHITLENITLYSCPGSGMVGNGALHHLAIRGCKIMRRPGTTRMLSTAADCLHVGNSQGKIIVENCEFAHAGDDCINIHDKTSQGLGKLGSHVLLLKRVKNGRNLFAAGDQLAFNKKDFTPIPYRATIIEASYNDEVSTCRVVVKEAIPDDLDTDAIIFNTRFQTKDYIIRNNSFHSNRARGILLHGSNGLVENNRFYNIQGSAVQIEAGAEPRWAEGTGVHNLIFRQNWIENCDCNRWNMAVIYMGTYLVEGRTTYPIFSKIIFEENTIVNCPRMAYFISSAKDILIKNNVLINTNTCDMEGKVFGSSQKELPMYDELYKGNIMVTSSSSITIEKNTCLSYVPVRDKSIYQDEATTYDIIINGNTGFTK